jgi:hypothetical protein
VEKRRQKRGLHLLIYPILPCRIAMQACIVMHCVALAMALNLATGMVYSSKTEIERTANMRASYIVAFTADTVRLLKHPWSSPKNFLFRRCRRSNLDQNLPRITNPVSDLTGDQ